MPPLFWKILKHAPHFPLLDNDLKHGSLYCSEWYSRPRICTGGGADALAPLVHWNWFRLSRLRIPLNKVPGQTRVKKRSPPLARRARSALHAISIAGMHACTYVHVAGKRNFSGREAKFFFPPQLWTPSTNSFAYSQSELHDMNMNDLRLRNKSTHARGLVILLSRWREDTRKGTVIESLHNFVGVRPVRNYYNFLKTGSLFRENP